MSRFIFNMVWKQVLNVLIKKIKKTNIMVSGFTYWLNWLHVFNFSKTTSGYQTTKLHDVFTIYQVRYSDNIMEGNLNEWIDK